MINYLNEDELYMDRDCSECYQYQKKLLLIQSQMLAVVNILFGKDDFDKVRLENRIDEICDLLDMDIPEGQIVVQESKEAHARRWNKMVTNFMEKSL